MPTPQLDLKKIANLIKEKGVTEKNIVDASGITYIAVHSALIGKSEMPDKLLETIADLCGVTPDTLYRYPLVVPRVKKKTLVLDIDRTKALINVKGVTQTEAANKLGYSPLSFRAYVNGVNRISMTFLEKLADYLGVSPNTLLKDAPSGPEANTKANVGRIYCPYCHKPVYIEMDAHRNSD